MEDFVIHQRATYRQKTPRPTWRSIPDDAADALFGALRSHRDRALVSFLRHASVSSTQVYTQPRLEDLVAKVLEHHARPRPVSPLIEPAYDEAMVRELLGLPA